MIYRSHAPISTHVFDCQFRRMEELTELVEQSVQRLGDDLLRQSSAVHGEQDEDEDVSGFQVLQDEEDDEDEEDHDGVEREKKKQLQKNKKKKKKEKKKRRSFMRRRNSIFRGRQDDFFGLMGDMLSRKTNRQRKISVTSTPASRMFGTMRPARNMPEVLTMEHSGSPRSVKQVFVQGLRPNKWHNLWMAVFVSGIAVFETQDAALNQDRKSVFDIYFDDLVLPTGNPVDIVDVVLFSQNKFAFCLNTEHETFIFATATSKDRKSFIEAISSAYEDFLKSRIRRKLMMQITWQVSEDPQAYVSGSKKIATGTLSRSSSATNLLRKTRNSLARLSRSRTAFPHDDLNNTGTSRDVLHEMLRALDEKHEIDLTRLIMQRKKFRAFLAWKALHTYRKSQMEAKE